jgi:hypothetical protein
MSAFNLYSEIRGTVLEKREVVLLKCMSVSLHRFTDSILQVGFMLPNATSSA